MQYIQFYMQHRMTRVCLFWNQIWIRKLAIAITGSTREDILESFSNPQFIHLQNEENKSTKFTGL